MLALSLALQVALASPWDIAPPPRGQWMLDRTGKVSASTVSAINQLAQKLDDSGAGQLGVLVTDTTSGVVPRDFATGVFNSWGVGHHGANDGILLFFALNDRKSEIVLGDGSKVKSSQTDAVMRDDVVANMKRGNLDLAILEASKSLITLMRAAGGLATPSPNDNSGLGGNTYVTPTYSVPERDEELAAYVEGGKAFAERSPRSWVVDPRGVLTASQRAQLDVAASDIYSADKGRIFFLVVRRLGSYPSLGQLAERLQRQVEPLSKLPVSVIALDTGNERGVIKLPFLPKPGWDEGQLINAENRLAERFDRTNPAATLLDARPFVQTAMTTGIPSRPMSEVLRRGYESNKGFFMIGGVLSTIGGLFWLRRWNRKRVRVCEECENPRQLLGDAAEDKHLSAAQLTEESLRSVDYDVWWCGRCNDVLVLRYGAIFSRYSACGGCGAKTMSSTCTTLERATEWSGGLERIDESCQHCSYKNSYTRTTARLQSSSSSDSSWSSSSSSSSSFGGGSSSGGGSSGSW